MSVFVITPGVGQLHARGAAQPPAGAARAQRSVGGIGSMRNIGGPSARKIASAGISGQRLSAGRRGRGQGFTPAAVMEAGTSQELSQEIHGSAAQPDWLAESIRGMIPHLAKVQEDEAFLQSVRFGKGGVKTRRHDVPSEVRDSPEMWEEIASSLEKKIPNAIIFVQPVALNETCPQQRRQRDGAGAGVEGGEQGAGGVVLEGSDCLGHHGDHLTEEQCECADTVADKLRAGLDLAGHAGGSGAGGGGGSMERVFGVVVQSKVPMDMSSSGCYLLKTHRHVCECGACTRFTLQRASCGGQSLEQQLTDAWLL